MAFVIQFPDDDDYYANVDFKVGLYSGHRDDVFLVKALLKLIYSLGQGDHKLPPGITLKVNTHVDKPMVAAIKHYQSTFQKRVRPDGVVSRCDAGSLASGVNFTIIHMQLEAGRVLAGKRINKSVIGYLRSEYPHLALPFVKAAPQVLSESASNEGGPHEVFSNL